MTLDHLTRQYSDRLGVLTAEQLQQALDRFDLGRLVDATPTPGGAFGQNLFLTSTRGDYVLRGKHHYDWQFPKERFFAQLIAGHTNVPAPWPYLIDEANDIFGFDYAIMPRLPGLSVDDPGWQSLKDMDELSIAGALGRCLAELHSITWPHCGECESAEVAIVPIETSYRDWISGIVERRIDKARERSSQMTEADAAWCRQILVSNAEALDVPFQPTLVHHDYKLGNVVVQRAGDGWRVSGVFDLMECYFGDADEDLVRQILFYELPGQHARPGSELPAAFLNGYTEEKALRTGFRERFRINMLRDCLLVWEFVHHRVPVRPEAMKATQKWFIPGMTFRAWAEPFVSLDPFPN